MISFGEILTAENAEVPHRRRKEFYSMNFSLRFLSAFFALFAVLFFFEAKNSSAQDSSSHFDLNGYIKNLQTFSISQEADSVYLSNLVHNRINFSFHPGKHFLFHAGARNLLFVGDQVRYTPYFSKLIDQDNGYWDLSFVWLDNKSVVGVTQFDRLYADWKFKNGLIRAGRQRINWGINITWNPNDIFNTYNFLDFDYEERPGADALRFEYYFSGSSQLDFGVSRSGEDSTWIVAAKYGFNKWGYDFQVLGGNYRNDIVAGLGFAGNIGTAGFKGELSYFQPRETFFDTSGAVSISSGVDYAFGDGWYVNGSFLYNSAATDQIYSVGQLTGFQLTPKTLMPAKWSFLVQGTKSFTPLLSGNFSVVYSPKVNLLILLPYLSYSIAENWDADLNLQTFFAENPEQQFKSLGTSVNLRVKWSF